MSATAAPTQNGHTFEGDAGDKPLVAPPSEEHSEEVVNDGSQDAESGEEDGGAPKPAADANLRKKVTLQAEQIADYEALLQSFREDPELWQQMQAKVQGRRQAPADPLDGFEAVATELGFNEKAAPALAKLAQAVAAATEQRVLQRLEPALRETIGSAQETKRLTGLRRSGVDPADVETEEFQDFAREYRAENPWVKHVEKGDPTAFWGLLGKAWRSREGADEQRATRAERDGLARAASSLERRGSAGAPIRRVAQQVKVKRGSDDAQSILKLLQRGIPQESIVLD